LIAAGAAAGLWTELQNTAREIAEAGAGFPTFGFLGWLKISASAMQFRRTRSPFCRRRRKGLHHLMQFVSHQIRLSLFNEPANQSLE
jgi:hypothetical protein